MKPFFLLILLCAGHTGWAQAEIYKHVDAEGNVTYTSTPMRGAKKLDISSTSSSSPSQSRPRNEAASADFPKVDNATQRNRDDARHRILMDELATEEKLLAEVRKSLKEAEANPETFSGADGKAQLTLKHSEKIRTLQQQVTQHEKNLDALRIELSSNRK
ncbi:MAG: DUF4124 domain-containing protein [Gallionellaceae bacterium]|nr:DUF4124 domain-containing protein [Gallionellaceae bacterium]